jgi:hypothetical protein
MNHTDRLLHFFDNCPDADDDRDRYANSKSEVNCESCIREMQEHDYITVPSS